MANTAYDVRNNKVVVKKIPRGLHRDKLVIHFQRHSNGGGDISSLVYPRSLSQKDEAIIAFTDPATVSTVTKKQHSIKIRGKSHIMQVSEFPPEVFERVSIYLNSGNTEENVAIQNLLAEFNIHVTKNKDEKNHLVKYAGDWFEIKAFVERHQALLNRDTSQVSTDAGRHHVDETGQQMPFNENFDNVIEVDEDVLKVTQKFKPNLFENITNQFNIRTFSKSPGKVLLSFDETKADYSDGISQFQSIYSYSMENMKQINYDLPQHLKHPNVEKILEVVRREHPQVVISKSADKTGRVMFLSASVKLCEDARAQLKHLIHGSRHQPTSRRPQEPSSEVLLDIPLSSGLKLAVICGNIAAQDTDAIVNAANAKLKNGAGVSGAIFRAGGKRFEDECNLLMSKRKYKQLDVGEVVHTKACGNLLCKNVIHVTGPMWSRLSTFRRESQCAAIMKKLCRRLIACANNDLHATSVSIPAISTGIYGVPLHIFCDAILEEAKRFDQFSKSNPHNSHLKRINIVNYDDMEAAEIGKLFRKRGSSVDP